MPLTSLEKSCIDNFRAGLKPGSASPGDTTGLLQYGLWLLFRIGRILRSRRASAALVGGTLKSDGSPITAIEYQIEELVKESFVLLPGGTVFVGEESGGNLPSIGLALALDPIDGTWSFLSHSDTCSTSLAFFKNGSPIIGMVMNPATGEIGYAVQGKRTRLLQISLLGEEDEGVDLPTTVQEETPTCLVNFHPSRKSGNLAELLYRLWNEGVIQLVKSTGGSPAWALLEASKGHFLYINLWAKKAALPYDLAAGILQVRGAGGDVVDADLTPIPFVGYIRPFIAGTRLDAHAHLLKQLQQVL